MVKKSSEKWRMFVDFTNLNKECPKYSFSLPSIDRLVDVSTGHKYISFMDAFSGYNQIAMVGENRERTTIIIEDDLYCYKHLVDLQEVFDVLRLYGMRLNPKKCAFRVGAEKFLGFFILKRGIEANLEMIKAIMDL
ncbi:hypothetical protein HRI_000667700 [Hibiscus trionum]|uniref:Reverse transcriptase domain-containing protein n=1 Tax=Hibiscus trionum TaxID=183268 RepID=A0A9W7H2N5_HIBTR|nr:hypothetical protein HRI_000667700 [Hibiscus trionum]